jgi:preprotein translocase subunit SecA
MRQGLVHDTFRIYVPAESVEEQWDLLGLEKALEGELQLKLPLVAWVRDEPTLGEEDILRRLLDHADATVCRKGGAGRRQRVARL